jgi:hypothetical protein
MNHIQDPDADDLREGTEDRRVQDRHAYAEREAIAQTQEAEAVARARVEALEAVLNDAQDYQGAENQTLDTRGHMHNQDLQGAHARQTDAADGVLIGTVLAAHLAQQAGEFWQQRQEERIDAILRAQPDDPALDAENSYRDQILEADLANAREASFESWGAPGDAELGRTESNDLGYTDVEASDWRRMDTQTQTESTDYSVEPQLSMDEHVYTERDNGYE